MKIHISRVLEPLFVNFAGNNQGAKTGQLWYDVQTYVWKYQYPTVTTSGSWRSGNNLNTARAIWSGLGIPNICVIFWWMVEPTTYR